VRQAIRFSHVRCQAAGSNVNRRAYVRDRSAVLSDRGRFIRASCVMKDLRCPACRNAALTYPRVLQDDQPVTCAACGAHVSTFGELKRRTEQSSDSDRIPRSRCDAFSNNLNVLRGRQRTASGGSIGIVTDLHSTNDVEPKRKRPKYSERNRDDLNHPQLVHVVLIRTSSDEDSAKTNRAHRYLCDARTCGLAAPFFSRYLFT
jgi:ribosomal protein S27E